MPQLPVKRRENCSALDGMHSTSDVRLMTGSSFFGATVQCHVVESFDRDFRRDFIINFHVVAFGCLAMVPTAQMQKFFSPWVWKSLILCRAQLEMSFSDETVATQNS